ncbi:MAG: hypothetical protein JKY50_18740, partial [Oleispira sp.]|nr:hypothetical protein [Oleispira sp.]
TSLVLLFMLSACSGRQATTQADPVNIASLGQSEITDVRAADVAATCRIDDTCYQVPPS